MRTFRKVSEMWNEKHPEDKMSPGVVARIHHVALAKIKALLDEPESVDITDDLKECLDRKDRT